MNERDRVIDFMKKIPVFNGLSDDEFKSVLSISSKKVFNEDEEICKEGDESSELFIILKGRVRVTIGHGTLLTHLGPMKLVGEIGVFTDKKRIATVVAHEKSTLMKISKADLFKLFNSNSSLSVRLLINVISELSDKLIEDNDIIDELRNKKRTRII